jgi:threonylcarbamoyladenosine tRNA methylthiotransferase MtaB
MNPFSKVAFHTLGCKLNFSESSTLAQQFLDSGFARVDVSEQPDVCIVNTCSVTDNADKKCRNIVRKVKRSNPNAFVAVIGCYAQLKPKEISEIPGVNLVLGAGEKFNILDHITAENNENEGKIIRDEIKYVKDFVPGFSSGDRTRTFLKVQDGCNYFCSFCTIPLARGRSRSANVEKTIESAIKAINEGAKEIVLTGVNIGDFGNGSDENFFDLVKALDSLKHQVRFRISSIEPNLLSNEIIDWVAQSKKFVPHFHIPLQSGSDNMLESMRRRYNTTLYTQRIEKIKSTMPNACIGVDVIVGFPGETDAEFEKTKLYLANLDVSYLHVFTYSERANTTALKKDEIVPMPVRHARSKELQKLSLRKKRLFYEQQLHKTGTVLWEKEDNDGQMMGFTKNYIKVAKPFNASLCNTEESVKYSSIHPDGYMTITP